MKLIDLFEEDADDVADQTKWVIANLGSQGLLLKSRGMTIKLNAGGSEELLSALKTGDELTVSGTDGKDFIFTPTDQGFTVKFLDDKMDGFVLTHDDIDKILDIAQ